MTKTPHAEKGSEDTSDNFFATFYYAIAYVHLKLVDYPKVLDYSNKAKVYHPQNIRATAGMCKA